MKHLAVALIVLALLAADLACDAGWVHTAHAAKSGWDTAATFALIYAAFYFWKGRS